MAETATRKPKSKTTKAKVAKTHVEPEVRKKARAFVPLISRHRPKTFSQMIGMETTVKAVSTSIKSGDIPNAYLLVGTTGCGKTTMARIIARSVMCETYDGCGVCDSCKAFDASPDGHMDYMEVNCGERGKIDDMRGIIQSSYTSPMLGNMRVIVLDESHRLTPQAAEALLKPLEEPAERTLWILATTETQSLKDTIKNRCNIIPIRPADQVQLAEYLADMARDYIDYPSEDLYLITEQIAQMTGGYIRHSLSILDTVIQSYRSSNGKMDVADFLEEVRTEILNNTDVDTLAAQKVIMGVILGNPKAILTVLGNHADFVGLSRNLVATSQYLLDELNGVTGSNIYHPPAFRETAGALKSRLQERGIKVRSAKVMTAYATVLEVVVKIHSEVMKFSVPERPLINANLMNLSLDMRERFPKKDE